MAAARASEYLLSHTILSEVRTRRHVDARLRAFTLSEQTRVRNI